MTHTLERTDVVRRYTEAQKMHYDLKNLEGALSLYKNIMRSYPDSKEAGYCCSQILHIGKAIVAKENLLSAQIKMVREDAETHPSPFV